MRLARLLAARAFPRLLAPSGAPLHEPQLPGTSKDIIRASCPPLPSAGSIGPEWMDIAGEGGTRLAYNRAANIFVEWLQSKDETGEIAKPRLEKLYRLHCAELKLAWLPNNLFFRELARVASRHQRRVPRGDGIRQRVTTYDIPRLGRRVRVCSKC